jgi:hypothetical protein
MMSSNIYLNQGNGGLKDPSPHFAAGIPGVRGEGNDGPSSTTSGDTLHFKIVTLLLSAATI